MTHPTDALRLVPVSALEEVRDLLMERIHGNPARSAGHNARLAVEAILAAPASPLPGGGTYRVDFKSGDLQSGGDLDDLAISGDLIEMVRVERMSGDSCWGMIYMKDGQHIRLSWSSSKGKLAITAESDA